MYPLAAVELVGRVGAYLVRARSAVNDVLLTVTIVTVIGVEAVISRAAVEDVLASQTVEPVWAIPSNGGPGCEPRRKCWRGPLIDRFCPEVDSSYGGNAVDACAGQ